MSVPARSSGATAPARRSATGRTPASQVPARRTPAPKTPVRPTPARTPAREPIAAPGPLRLRRPAFHPGFLFFSTALVTALVTGVVVLNVLLAQQAFQVRTLRSQITSLQGQQVSLTERLASLSAPGRVQSWASAHGMVTPPDVFVLPVRGSRGGATGAASSSAVGAHP